MPCRRLVRSAAWSWRLVGQGLRAHQKQPSAEARNNVCASGACNGLRWGSRPV